MRERPSQMVIKGQQCPPLFTMLTPFAFRPPPAALTTQAARLVELALLGSKVSLEDVPVQPRPSLRVTLIRGLGPQRHQQSRQGLPTVAHHARVPPGIPEMVGFRGAPTHHPIPSGLPDPASLRRDPTKRKRGRSPSGRAPALSLSRPLALT